MTCLKKFDFVFRRKQVKASKLPRKLNKTNNPKSCVLTDRRVSETENWIRKNRLRNLKPDGYDNGVKEEKFHKAGLCFTRGSQKTSPHDLKAPMIHLATCRTGEEPG